jgi:hypothetical protein
MKIKNDQACKTGSAWDTVRLGPGEQVLLLASQDKAQS